MATAGRIETPSSATSPRSFWPVRKSSVSRESSTSGKAVRRGMHLRPTAFGAVFGLLTVALFLLAVNYGNNLAYALSFFLLSLALNASWICYRNAAGLDLRFLGAQAAFAGEPAVFRFRVANATPRHRWRLALRSGAGSGADRLDLSAKSADELRFLVSTGRRGHLFLDDLALVSTFPFGLFETRFVPAVAGDPPSNWIYPRLGPDLTLPVPHGRNGFQSSPEASDQAGARAYQPGDPLSRVDWKASARATDLMTKEFDGGEWQPVLTLDLAETPGPDLEARLSQLARWILEAQHCGLRFVLRLPGFESAIGAGPRHATQCLEALARYDGV